MSVMAEVMKLPDDEPPGGANQPSAASNNSFHELNSLKTLLGKTWSELSNVMTRYHAQIVEKHQELEVTSLCADATRISRMDSDLKMLRTENGRLVTQILDSKSENTKLRTENRKLKDEVTMKDTLIEKIQNQMTQEALDYQAELASLKEILEARSRGAEVTAPLITSPDVQPAKRRKVSQQSSAPPKGATVQSPGAGVSSRGTTVTPVRSDVTTARSDVTPARNLPSTSSESPLRNDSFRKLSSSKASDFVQSGTEDNTSHSGRGFVKLDEVTDESNLDELEGILSEQESELLTEGQAEIVSLGGELYDLIDLPEVSPNLSVVSPAGAVGGYALVRTRKSHTESPLRTVTRAHEHRAPPYAEQPGVRTVRTEFNIGEVLRSGAVDAWRWLEQADTDAVMPELLRRRMQRALVGALIARFGWKPTAEQKTSLARELVEKYEVLRDTTETGYGSWYTPCRNSTNRHGAVGFLETCLRNRRRRQERRPSLADVTSNPTLAAAVHTSPAQL